MKAARLALASAALSVPLSACASPPAKPLRDGLYAVAHEAPTEKEVRATSGAHRVLIDEGKLADPTTTRPPRWLALETSTFVPLVLEGAPTTEQGADGRTLLSVTLAREHVASLESFTRARLNQSAAIVLDGQVVTVHEIKSVIDGGRLQITRCNDDACHVLRSKLAD